MKKKKLKVFALPIEEFEKKYPVSYSIVVPGIPEGHVAKVVSVRPCQTFIISVDMQKIMPSVSQNHTDEAKDSCGHISAKVSPVPYIGQRYDYMISAKKVPVPTAGSSICT